MGAETLVVYVPNGKDGPVRYALNSIGLKSGTHPPVNYHAYAACVGGVFTNRWDADVLGSTNVLLIITSQVEEALLTAVKLKALGKKIFVTFKETGFLQIALQLQNKRNLEFFRKLMDQVDGVICPVPALQSFFDSYKLTRPNLKIQFIPTPYPVDHSSMRLRRDYQNRQGIFLGTREFFKPARNHFLGLEIAFQLSEATAEPVTLIFKDGWQGRRLLKKFNWKAGQLRLLERTSSYGEFLDLLSKHKLVVQWDQSLVPGQIAGDCLLTSTPCLGGNGAIDGLTHDKLWSGSWTQYGFELLTNEAAWQNHSHQLERVAQGVSFGTIGKQLREFLG
jgi:hypothetical protein